MWQRLLAIVRKELIGMLRDPRARMSLIIPPVIQLVIFAQAATMEVKNIELAIVDLDRGPAAFEVIQRLRGSPSFERLPLFPSVAAARTQVDLENVIGLLGDEVADQREPEVFVSSLEDNATITVRALVDDPSAAERLQHDLRLRAHRRLRAAGIYA